MLQETRFKQLQEIIDASTQDELIWINGYLNNILSAKSPKLTSAAIASSGIKKMTILFGTETGNSKNLAIQFASAAKKQGVMVKHGGLDQYRLSDLSKEEYLFIVVSTHGEGEPPETAKKFYDYIHDNSLSLSHINYGILALGDSSYPLFCKTGEDIDNQLNLLGATRLFSLKKCDVDYEEDAKDWFQQILGYSTSSEIHLAPIANEVAKQSVAKKVGKKYYKGEVVTNINLNDSGSLKETYHIEITSDEVIEYEAGDALAMIPSNDESIVDSILKKVGIDSETPITTAKHSGTVKELLLNHLNISYLLNSTIKKYASLVGEDIQDIRTDLLHLLNTYPVKDNPQFIEVIGILTPIAPRLYTISSSPQVHDTEVHIIVRRDEYISDGSKGYGHCSQLLGLTPVESTINFYIHKNKHFKLPNHDKDLIMIGPGTGIAPFRSFLAERDAVGASGKNWLFFGEHYFQKDFLYQTEIQNYLQTDVLQKVSLAFSRDQPKKVYVQDRMMEEGKEFFNWVKSGASIYLSGTKDPMSFDVENSILHVFEKYGQMSSEEAKSYWDTMKNEGRYQKEVY